MELSKLKVENSKAIVILIAGLAAVVILIMFLQKTFGGVSKAFSAIGQALGLSDSPSEAKLKDSIAKATAQSADNTSPWSPQFYKNAPSGASLTTQANADIIAGQIWDSVGGFWSAWNIDEVIAALKQLDAQSQVSFVADRFNSLYNKDLLTWLTMQYTAPIGGPDPGLQTCIDYVNGLSKY